MENHPNAVMVLPIHMSLVTMTLYLLAFMASFYSAVTFMVVNYVIFTDATVPALYIMWNFAFMGVAIATFYAIHKGLGT